MNKLIEILVIIWLCISMICTIFLSVLVIRTTIKINQQLTEINETISEYEERLSNFDIEDTTYQLKEKANEWIKHKGIQEIIPQD